VGDRNVSVVTAPDLYIPRHPIMFSFVSLSILSFYLSLVLASVYFFLNLTPKILLIFLLSDSYHMPCPSHPFFMTLITLEKIKITMLLTAEFSPSPAYFILPKPIPNPQHFVQENTQPAFFP